MRTLIPYLKLMRFDKPIGILLLLWPTYWALWLASTGAPPVKLIVLFTLGVIIMRAAGCVINDIADRQIDKFVERTKFRPLTNGDITLIEAILTLVTLLLLALLIVSQLNAQCFYLAMIAALITVIYPFCKRFINAPQLVLGLAFSWGIPMAFAAQSVPLNTSLLLLMLLNIAWTVSYDTMYAMVDKADDLRIGVKSTAILFGDFDRSIIAILQVFSQCLWLTIAWLNHFNIVFISFWLVGTGYLIHQFHLLVQRETEKCFIAFKNSHWYGFIMWLSLVIIN